MKAPFNRLYIVLDGLAVINTKNNELQIKKGHAYIVPSNLSYSCHTPKHLKKIYTHFLVSDSFHTDIFDQANDILELPIDIKHYTQHFDAIENKTSDSYFDIKTDFTKLIYQFIKSFGLDTNENKYLSLSPKLKKLHKLLNVDITAKTRTKDLANYLNISQSMLSKTYKAETGITLKDFIQHKLIQKSQLLLLTTSKSIQEIAYELGYDDALYFSRVFKKRIGVSPTTYRATNRVVQ